MRLVRVKVGSEVTWLRPDAVTALYVEERYEFDQNTWAVHAVVRDPALKPKLKARDGAATIARKTLRKDGGG